MTDLDTEIEEALNAEDRALRDQFKEQGIFQLVFSVYRGPDSWIMIITTIVSFIMAIVAFYSIWQVFQVGPGSDAIKWGGLAVLMMLMVSFIKVWFWIRMEGNRVIREIKRLELQIARLQNQ